LEGAESGTHKAHHDYRVVEQHSYPIFCDDWGADEELLLIDGAQIYGLGNWADIADHIGNRTKEEVEDHYIRVFIEGRDGTAEGDVKSERIVRSFLQNRHSIQAKKEQLPVAGPNLHFKAEVGAEEFQKRKRQRIDDMRKEQAAFSVVPSSQAKDSQGNLVKAAPPKPLVSAPTSHSELGGFMPGRLEFETEYEQEAENFVKDMEFGKVYRFGGEMMPSELEALGGRAEQGKSRMEASGRGGPSVGSRGANKANKAAKGGESVGKEDSEGEAEEEEDVEKEGDEEDEEEKEEKEEDDENEEGEEPSQMDTSMFEGDDTQTSQSIDVTKGAEKQAASNGAANSAAAAAAAANSAAPPAETDDRAPDWDEDEGDLDLKLCILDIYNERLERRGRRKEFMFNRNLVDYKRTIAAERKRLKEERELLHRVRHFAQMQTALDFEDFYSGLCYEDALRRAASQLQMYRKAGITNFSDATKFDVEQAERNRKALVASEGGLAAFPVNGSLPRNAAARNARDTSTAAGVGGGVEDGDSGTATPTPAAARATSTNRPRSDEKKPARKPPKPLDLSQNPSLNLLTRAEKELCSVVRIQPQVFMVMKKEIITEYVRRKGRFTRRESRVLFKCDVNKVGRVYDLMESEGYLAAALQLGGSGWNGTGTPPGYVDKGALLSSTTSTNQAGPSNQLEASNISEISSQAVDSGAISLPAITQGEGRDQISRHHQENQSSSNSINNNNNNNNNKNEDQEQHQQQQHSQQTTLTA